MFGLCAIFGGSSDHTTGEARQLCPSYFLHHRELACKSLATVEVKPKQKNNLILIGGDAEVLLTSHQSKHVKEVIGMNRLFR